jgi:hypothetical protein
MDPKTTCKWRLDVCISRRNRYIYEKNNNPDKSPTPTFQKINSH